MKTSQSREHSGASGPLANRRSGGGAVLRRCGSCRILTQPQYESSAQLFVQTQGTTASDLQSLYQGGQFSQNQVQSYVSLIHSPLILGPVKAP